jgi:hypothetical protein
MRQVVQGLLMRFSGNSYRHVMLSLLDILDRGIIMEHDDQAVVGD